MTGRLLDLTISGVTLAALLAMQGRNLEAQFTTSFCDWLQQQKPGRWMRFQPPLLLSSYYIHENHAYRLICRSACLLLTADGYAHH